MRRFGLVLVSVLVVVGVLLLVWSALDEGQAGGPGARGDLSGRDESAVGEGRGAASGDASLPADPGVLDAGRLLASGPQLPTSAPGEARPIESGNPTTPVSAVPAHQRASLQLLVLHADGKPASGGCVALTVGDEVLASGRLDAAGRVSLEGALLPGDVWVAGVCAPAQLHHLEPCSGDQRIQLEAGESIVGRVTVGGRAPDTPILLHLRPDFRDTRAVKALNDALIARSPGLESGEYVKGVLTAPDGSFRISGLRAGWFGQLAFPCPPYVLEGQRLAESQEGVQVSAPGDFVDLALRRLPRLVGRLLLPDGAPAVRLPLQLELQQGSQSSRFELKTDAQGRFGGEIDLQFIDQLRLRATDGGERAALDAVRTDLDVDPVQGVDLGELRLEPVARLLFEVRDPQGAPVIGAQVVAGGDHIMAPGARVSRPTGSDGRGELVGLPPGTSSIDVHAPRFASVRIALAGGAGGAWAAPVDGAPDGRCVITLQPCASVDVVADLPQVPKHAPSTGLTLVLEAEPALFGRADYGPQRERRIAGLLPVRAEQEAARWKRPQPAQPPRWALRPPPAGLQRVVSNSHGSVLRLSCSCLADGVPFRVGLADSQGTWFTELEEPGLRPGEWRRVDIEPAGELRSLAVLVTDVGGRPVKGASVLLGRASTRTDGTGRCRFHAVGSATVTLCVGQPGFAASVLRDVPVPRDGAPVPVVLRRGVSVDLAVVDGADRPVQPQAAYAESPEGFRLAAGEVCTGGAQFRELPPGPVLLVVEWFGERHELAHDAREGKARLELPGGGDLRVRWQDASGAWPAQVLVAPEGQRERAVLHEVSAAERQAGHVDLLALPGGCYVLSARGPRGAEPRVQAEACVVMHQLREVALPR